MEHSNSSEYNYQDQKIIEKQIEGEIKTSFISYAVSVLTARALPDVRDGSSRCTGVFCTPCTRTI